MRRGCSKLELDPDRLMIRSSGFRIDTTLANQTAQGSTDEAIVEANRPTIDHRCDALIHFVTGCNP